MSDALPPIVSDAEWQAAQARLLAKDKEATRARDALSAERRRQPMTEITADFRFDSADGRQLRLLDLFEGRRQLLLYHFMFTPDVPGWPDAGCVGCSLWADQVCHLAHLQARDTSMCFVSSAPVDKVQAYKQPMGWRPQWYSNSAAGPDFSAAMGLKGEDGKETHGLSVFLRDGERVFRTHFTSRRGLETVGGVWTLLDLTPYGRQEAWESSPEGWPQSATYSWLRRHDEHEKSEKQIDEEKHCSSCDPQATTAAAGT
jgi:predicted dithiol-disulfide oxidoreductase (DUF899 family)